AGHAGRVGDRQRLLAGGVGRPGEPADHRRPARHHHLRRRPRLVPAAPRGARRRRLSAGQGGADPLHHATCGTARRERDPDQLHRTRRDRYADPGPVAQRLRPGLSRRFRQPAGPDVGSGRTGCGAGVPQQRRRQLHHRTSHLGRRRHHRRPCRQQPAGVKPMSTASMTEFRRVADQVRNWGRWGTDDELGTLNFITAEKVTEAAGLVRQGKVFALGGDFGSAGPQGAFQVRQNPVHVMTVDGGDINTLAQYGPQWLRNSVAHQVSEFFVDNPFRFNDDMIVMPLQAATQWDALSHVYYDDQLYNGFPAGSVTSFGAFHCGIDKVDHKGITSRGVLLDVVRHRGAEVFLEPGQPVTPEELDEVAAAQGVTIRSGAIVVVHTGWWTRFLSTGDGAEPGSGLHWRCAIWLHEHEVAAVAADNLKVEDP